MNLRLPVLATVVTAAAAVAAFRALRHEPPPAGSGSAAGFAASDAMPRDSAAAGGRSSEPASGLAAGALAAGALAAGVSNAGYGGQRRFSSGFSGTAPVRVTVYVAGEVARAGVYALPESARSVDALKAAGGAIHGADLVAVNLAEPLRDGEEIVVPKIGAAPPPESDPAVGATEAGPKPHAHHRKKRRKRHARRPVARDAAASDAASAPDSDATGTVVDLNSADENELETLPGIGASLAERIVAFREANGPYASPDDLLDVGGMTQSRLDAIEPYVTTRY